MKRPPRMRKPDPQDFPRFHPAEDAAYVPVKPIDTNPQCYTTEGQDGDSSADVHGEAVD